MVDMFELPSVVLLAGAEMEGVTPDIAKPTAATPARIRVSMSIISIGLSTSKAWWPWSVDHASLVADAREITDRYCCEEE